MATNHTRPRYVSIAECAEILGVTEMSIRRWIADGTIPAGRLGSKVVRIREDALYAAVRPIPSGRA